MGEKLDVYQKLAILKKAVPYIQKQAKEYMRFTVVESSDVLKAIQPTMDELGLLLEPHITNSVVERIEIGVNEKTKKKIFSYLVHLDISYVWVNTENRSEKVTVEFTAVADDENSSYAFGQATTYAEKTFILRYFNIPTDDMDPDVFQQEVLKRVPAAEEQIESLYVLVDKVRVLTGQTKKVVIEQAKVTANINMSKDFEDYTAYDFGIASNILNKWVNGYEKQKLKDEKEKEKQKA